MRRHFFVKRFWPAALHISATCIGRHSETVWHGQLQHAHHLGEVRTFAAEQIFHAHWCATVFVIECEDKRHIAVYAPISIERLSAERLINANANSWQTLV